MRAGSLFSGIGGLDCGLARAGLDHAFLCESDEWRRGVLAHRFPGVSIYDDVRGVRVGEPAGRSAADRLREATDDGRRQAGAGLPDGVDLLCGGFPCQDLSVAGRRAGLQAGERSSLFFEFMRVADELVQPGGYVLIENVPGLLSSQGGRDFALVLATLAELGFHDLAWRVLDSRYFGVPQRRRRVFIVGRRASGRRSAEILLEPESGGGDPAAGVQEGPTSARTLTSGSGDGRYDKQPLHYYVEDFEDGTLTSSTGRIDRHPLIADAGAQRESQERDAALELAGAGASTPVIADTLGAAVRRLTPVECERLQGLPDNWTNVPDTAPDSRRYAGLGDAVTATVGEWIGRRLLTIETKENAA